MCVRRTCRRCCTGCPTRQWCIGWRHARAFTTRTQQQPGSFRCGPLPAVLVQRAVASHPLGRSGSQHHHHVGCQTAAATKRMTQVQRTASACVVTRPCVFTCVPCCAVRCVPQQSSTMKTALDYSTPDAAAFWNAGLDGRGQIVGLGDSGIDMNSCFFSDPQVPFVAPSSSKEWINPQHRKVVYYWGLADETFRDLVGHGTHTAGSIAGFNPAAPDSKATGAAKGARLAFIDLSRTAGGDVNAPQDLERNYFPRMFERGACIFSGGCTAGRPQLRSSFWTARMPRRMGLAVSGAHNDITLCCCRFATAALQTPGGQRLLFMTSRLANWTAGCTTTRTVSAILLPATMGRMTTLTPQSPHQQLPKMPSLLEPPSLLLPTTSARQSHLCS